MISDPLTVLQKEQSALILHLQRLSTEDGPGLRTTVFFKQCPLACQWCHNPESISRERDLQWLSARCIGCKTCISLCPQGALELTPQGMLIDRQACDLCGLCSQSCPALAMELLGREINLQDLLVEVLKDRAFFEKSENGGVTVSGGEPMLQPEFTAAFLAALQAEGISTALDTCGLCSKASLDKVLPYADIVLFDLKIMDSRKHKLFTGQHNEIILENLLYIREQIKKSPSEKRLWIRTPLIPGATATMENIAAIGSFLAKNLADVLERWELLAFNNLATDKYQRLGMEWNYAGQPLMSQADLDFFEEIAKNSGLDPQMVSITGAARVED
jgi:pyruvate formate lyase activating enzyme